MVDMIFHSPDWKPNISVIFVISVTRILGVENPYNKSKTRISSIWRSDVFITFNAEYHLLYKIAVLC